MVIHHGEIFIIDFLKLSKNKKNTLFANTLFAIFLNQNDFNS